MLSGFLRAQQLGPAPRMPEGEDLVRLKDFLARKHTSSQPIVSPPVTWIDTTNKSTVQSFYDNQLLPSIDIATGWTGSIPSDIPGTTSTAYQNAVAARINWFRSMAGVPPVITLDPTEGAEDQQAALMMSVNNQLSHMPPSTWIDYTDAGKTAAGNSNLCLGVTLSQDPGCIQTGYIEDPGSNNSEAGHRRWILYPQTQLMATGDVAPVTTYSNANAVWVFDSHLNGTRPATRNGYVAWPPPGYVPYTVVYPRWSFSYPNANFSSATVTMTRNGSNVPIRIEALFNDQGVGENSIVWVPDNLDATQQYTPVRPSSDTTNIVSVNNVMINGSPQNFSYSVTVFDPAPAAVSITFNSNQSGAGVFVDGSFYSLPKTFSWTPGDTHTVSGAIYSGGPGILIYQSWSDNGGEAHDIVVPGSAATYTVNYLISQAITFGALSNVAYGVTPFTVSASATSGLAVTLTSNTTSVCTVSSNTVTIASAGGCSITASQSGNATYLPAASVTQTFAVQFVDVPSNAYYFNAINLLAQHGITAGCGNNSYCPLQNVARYQMAIFIVRAVEGGDNFTSSSTPYFSDVPANALGFKWIQKMYELGITTGCGGGNFCPNDNVTRDQMAVFIIRARYGATASFTAPPAPTFTDVPTTNIYFRWVQRLALDGITAGCGTGLYCPGSPVIRADMAIFIMRGMFNQLLPSGTPVVTQISPAALAPGASGTYTVTGSNTHFVQGSTTLSPIPGVTIGTITVASATSLTVQLTAASNAATQPDSIVAITGTEQAVLPNGLIVQ